MILKSLEMQGFKSFPDKTVLEFGKGITAIVGPNGSGKSNIADAVRWALGEQSTKSLRGETMEDVIFGGADKRKPLGFAEVTLRIEDPEAQNEDERSIIATRRYYRSGESEYRINGKAGRLKDIRERFADEGLCKNGYATISQGKINELVSPRSPRRRDMLEAAAGIARFRYRRAEANRELERAELNLTRLRDILSELESRVGPLKRQSEKAKKFLVLADEKKTLEIGLWLRAAKESKNALKECELKLSIAGSQYEAVENELSVLGTRIENATDEGGKATAEIERLRRAVSDAEEESAVAKGGIAVEAEAVERNKRETERVKREARENERSVSQIDAQINELLKRKSKNEAEIASKEEKLAEELKKLAELLEKRGEKNDKAGEINEKIARTAARSANAKAQNSAAASAKEKLNSDMENARTAAEAKREASRVLEKERAEAEKELERLKREVAGSEKASDEYKTTFNSLTEKLEKLRAEREALRRDAYAKNARIKTLDDLEKNLEGYAAGVRKTIKEAEKGALKGIRGTVSRLISVSPEYAAAIETALGPAVQNVVVEDEDAAKRAIYFLKENKAGRATFLPLNAVKARPFTEKGVEKCAGFVGTADKLVEYDPEYSEIVGYLLGRTVVSEDMDAGIATSRKFSRRFKIVTLDGQSLNAGGSITGGSRSPGAGPLSGAAEKTRLKKDVASLENLLEKKDGEINAVSEELNSARGRFEAGEAERARAKEAEIKAESALELVKNKLEAEKARTKEFENEIKEAENAAVREEENEKRTKAEILEAEEISLSLERELAKINSEREILEKTREEETKIRNALNLEIVALQKDVEADERAISERVERRENFRLKAEAAVGETARIEKENAASEAKIEELKASRARLREDSARREKEIERLLGKRTEKEAESVALRAGEREKNLEKEKLGGELARLEERRDSARKELEAIQNELYDEYALALREAEETAAELEDVPKAQIRLREIKNKIRSLGNVNVGAIEEYKDVYERYDYLNGRVDDVEKSRTELVRLIDELSVKMTERFKERFALINEAFAETFGDLFGGGVAELSLEDPRDALECNINITARPPGKSVRNIDLLSGGEKGLAAIALLFAVIKVSPASFYILDEVETSLDDANVSRYASYVREKAGNSQFILITHRRGTMDEADVLYGVTTQEEGVSKLLELKAAETAKKLGVE